MKESRDSDRRPVQNISENPERKKKKKTRTYQRTQKKKKRRRRTQIDRALLGLGRHAPRVLALPGSPRVTPPGLDHAQCSLLGLVAHRRAAWVLLSFCFCFCFLFFVCFVFFFVFLFFFSSFFSDLICFGCGLCCL